jgi:hypothetical protein
MSQFSNYLEQALVNHIFRDTAYSQPTSIYIALFTSDPGEDGAGAEVDPAGTWTDYVRQDAGGGGTKTSGWSSPADGVTQNAKVITFPANNGASTVVVTHVGIYDGLDPLNSNLLFYAPLVSSKSLLQGDVLSFGVGSITVTLA